MSSIYNFTYYFISSVLKNKVAWRSDCCLSLFAEGEGLATEEPLSACSCSGLPLTEKVLPLTEKQIRKPHLSGCFLRYWKDTRELKVEIDCVRITLSPATKWNLWGISVLAWSEAQWKKILSERTFQCLPTQKITIRKITFVGGTKAWDCFPKWRSTKTQTCTVLWRLLNRLFLSSLQMLKLTF